MSLMDWHTPDADLIEAVDHYRGTCLRVYEQDSNRVIEDLRKEYAISEGGYGRKQIQELLQNGADALRNNPGRLAVTLTEEALYVANQGTPFTADGLRGILYAHLSEKTGEEIGRFGLGFKSVAGISDSPQIFSQSVSFRFDREKTKEALFQINGIDVPKTEVPALRIAWPIEPTQEFQDDPVLRALAKWAVTVIKVPLLPGAATDLDREIQEFDESFCLFVPAVKELLIDSELSDVHKRFTVLRSGEMKREVELRDAEGTTSRWYVLTKTYNPSVTALENAGRTARRDTVEVSWAVPLEGRPKVGNLSAYFPVKSEISLSGKLNAPWKLSDDRIDLIAGEFNREILETVVPELVAEGRHFLGTLDPGRYIDILPARGRESKSWADEVINQPVFDALRKTRCIPNANLEMRSPNSVFIIPPIVPAFVAYDWMDLVEDKGEWVHPDCTSNAERKSKTQRLLGQNTAAPLARLRDWLETFKRESTSSSPATRSAAALRSLIAIQDEADYKLIEDISEVGRLSQIVLLESGAWAHPSRGQAVLRSTPSDLGKNFVHPDIAEDERAAQALTELGVVHFEEIGQIGDVIEQLRIPSAELTDEWWENAWSIFRTIEPSDLKLEFFAKLPGSPAKHIKVKNLNGEWVLPSGHYIAGELLKPNQEDGELLVDHHFHALDAEVLHLLDIYAAPTVSLEHSKEKWLQDYCQTYESELSTALQLNRYSLGEFDLELPVNLGPLENLGRFSAPNRARLTKFVLQRSFDSKIKVRSRKNTNATTESLHPNLWKVQKDGLLKTSIGYSPISECLLPSEDTSELEDILPAVLDLNISPEVVKALPFKLHAQDYSTSDFERLVLLHRMNDDESAVGKVYAWFCYFYGDYEPDSISVKSAGEWLSLPPKQVAVACTSSEESSLEKFGIATLPVPTSQDADYLHAYWSLLTFDDIPLEIDFDAAGEPQPLLFQFPNLLSLLADFGDDELEETLEGLEFQPCSGLELVSSLPGLPRSRDSVTRALRNKTLYVVGNDIQTQLRHVLELLNLELDEYRFEALVQETESQQLAMIKANLRAASSDAERLSLLFSNAELISQVPSQALNYAIEQAGAPLQTVQLAQVCIDMYGPACLERLSRGKVLTVGVPPKSWRGSFATRNWVKELGFGEEWAGRKTSPRSKPIEVVGGPAEPGEFHDYQASVSNNLRKMLSGIGPRRGLITLPTGAGKTRVAVQTIIEAIADGNLDRFGAPFNGPILWLVNNEDLCEQAIEAWAFLWSAVGRPNTDLTISRHFGSYDADEEPGGVQVVVATYQKTIGSTQKREFDWLKETPLVVIDEAHSALNSTYTKILRWTGRSSWERSKLLLGLTATPFISRSDSERTEMLLRRFDNNILDNGVFGDEAPMIRLQKDRVLSHVTMELIHTDSQIELSQEELLEFKETSWLPKRKESQLGLDIDRTLRIVNSIKSKPKAWSIIVFAASVENAETIAGMLTLDGIPAAAISSNTPAHERALALDRFRSKELRVLTNYNVLSQGFDAPKTDAVYITRPTQSEVRYQQMIGRGLRGPRNGGTEEVHLVNVLDNIREFPLSINYKPFEVLADSVDEG